jgi:glucose/arabinose dehydrogenase
MNAGFSRATSKRLLLVAASVSFALLFCEALLRIFMPQQLNWGPDTVWKPVEGLGRDHIPNLDTEVDTGEGPARVRTDELGHRIGAAPAVDADLKILAVGDSFVEALQVDYEEMMTSLLADSLSQALDRRVEVVNVAVGGWNPNHYLIATKRELERSPYDLVIVFVFMQNDLVTERVDSFPAATDLAPPRRGGSPDGGLRETIDSLAFALHAFIAKRSHLYVYLRNYMELRRMRSGSQPGHSVANIMLSERESPRWRITGGILAEIASVARQNETSVLFVLLPSDYYIDEDMLSTYLDAFRLDTSQVDVDQPARLLTAELEPLGLTVLDATGPLEAALETGRKDLFGRVDRHFGRAGHRLMADFLEPAALKHLAPRLTRPPEGVADYPVLEIRDSVLTSMGALPDGDLILGLRDGRLYRVHPGARELPEQVFHRLETIQTVEGGIIGLAASPTFQSDGYLYVNYTERADDKTEYLTVCRLRVDPNDPRRALPGSYEVIHRMPDDLPSEIHYGGGIVFGADGHLYIGVGDDSSASNAQNPKSLRGKILRLAPDGSIPDDNPVFPGGVGPTAVYAVGLRNPFRLVKDPLTGDIYVNDVGNSTWEEANRLESGGKNYGWPILEGPLEDNPGATPPDNYVDPFFSYRHRRRRGTGATSSAIVGGVVYQGDRFPEGYRHAYVVADFDQIGSSLFRVTLAREPQLRSLAARRFYETSGAIVDLVEIDGAIYYSSIWMDLARPEPWTSEVRRIDVLQNPLPRLALPVPAISAGAPARIDLEVSIEYPRPEELKVEWRLGGERVGTGTRLSTIVEDRGIYPLTVRATEPFGGQGEKTIPVRVFGLDPLSLDLAVEDVSRAGSPSSPPARLRLIDPRIETAASTVDPDGDLRPFEPLGTVQGKIRLSDMRLALFANELRLRLESPGLVPFERDFPFPDAGSGLPSAVQLSRHALSVRAVSPKRDPLVGVKLEFLLENGLPLPRAADLPATDLSGRLYLPLTEGQSVSGLVAVPSGDNPSIYTDVRYSRTATAGEGEDWTLVFSPRGAARFCDPLAPGPTPVSYEKVQAVFSVYCVGCHNNNRPALDLSLLEGFSFSELYLRDSLQMPGRKLFDPASPEDSYLLEKVTCLMPSDGYLMPPSSRGLLDRGDRQIITDWIHRGTAASKDLETSLYASQFAGESPLGIQLRAGAVGGSPPYEVHWDLGDGESSDSWYLQHTYNANYGTKVFRGEVTVRDSDGAERTSHFEVRVTAPHD